MAEDLAPVDTSVSIPKAIAAAAAAAEQAHKAAYGEPPPPPSDGKGSVQAPLPKPTEDRPIQITEAPPQPVQQPVQQAVQPQPQVPSARAEQPANEPPVPSPEEIHGDTWAARYNSMRGRYEQQNRTIGSMQQQMGEMGDELMRLHRLLDEKPQERSFAQNNPPQLPQITEQDREKFGDELLDLVYRVSKHAAYPDVQQVAERAQQIEQKVQRNTQNAVFNHLDALVPQWRQINVDPRFKAWASLRDIYSGGVRAMLLNEAIRAADAPRAAAFFKGFLAEENATGSLPAPQADGQQPPAPRQPAVPLETLAAPGAARPASGQGEVPSSLADKPIITRQQISWFYSQEGRRYYNGQEDRRKADEATIFAAQREGRVKG